MEKGWGKKEGLCGFCMTHCQYAAKKGRCGHRNGQRTPVISPNPKLALKMLLCSQLYLETYTNNPQYSPLHHQPLPEHLWSHPTHNPFPNWITQRIKQNPQGHEFERLRLPSETPSAEVKRDSWTRSMWEGKSQPHHKGNYTLLNWKTKT